MRNIQLISIINEENAEGYSVSQLAITDGQTNAISVLISTLMYAYINNMRVKVHKIICEFTVRSIAIRIL